MSRDVRQQELLAYEAYAKARREASHKYADDLERVQLRPKRDPRLPIATKFVPLPGPDAVAGLGGFTLNPEPREKPRKKPRGPDAVDEWFRHRSKR